MSTPSIQILNKCTQKWAGETYIRRGKRLGYFLLFLCCNKNIKSRGETNPYLGAARQQGFQNVVLTQVQKVIQRGVVVFFLYFGGEDGE